MTMRLVSEWFYSPQKRKETNKHNKNDPDMPNMFYVGIDGVENEDQIPERVRRRLKRQVKKILDEEEIWVF